MNHTTGLRITTRRASLQRTVRSAVLTSLFLPAFVLTGCAVVPMKTRTVGTTGKEGEIDLKFIQVDKTTREEIGSKLSWIDSGLKHQRLFWGRWYGSSSGVVNIYGPLAMLPYNDRRWHIHNLLVEFNASGVVERFGDFPDNKLNEELEKWLGHVGEPPLDLSGPLIIEIERGSQDAPLAPLRFTHGLALFTGSKGSACSVPRQEIERFEIDNYWYPGDSSSYSPARGQSESFLRVLFTFSRKGTGRGDCKYDNVMVSPSNYLTLVRYMEQTRGR